MTDRQAQRHEHEIRQRVLRLHEYVEAMWEARLRLRVSRLDRYALLFVTLGVLWFAGRSAVTFLP